MHSLLLMMMPSLVCWWVLISLVCSAKCDLIEVEPVVRNLMLLQPFVYNFSQGGTKNMLCATENDLVFDGGLIRDLVLQPTDTMLRNGTFLIEEVASAEQRENKEVCYSSGAFCFAHVISPQNRLDQLQVYTTRLNVSLTLRIQYIPLDSDIPFNLTFDYGPSGISFDRSTSSLDNFSPDDTLFFRLRDVTTTSICERRENGEEGCQEESGCFINAGMVFDAFTPVTVASCISPSQVINLNEQEVMLPNDQIEPGLRRLALIEGDRCVNNPSRMSEIINVTVVQNVPTPSLNNTTPSTTSAASTSPPATDNLIIIVCSVGAALVMIICLIIGVVYVKNRKKQSVTLPQDEIKMDNLQQEKQLEKEMTPEEKSGEEIKTQRETNKYVSYVIPPTTVTGIIFVSNDSTQSYKSLEDELLYQHRCDRIHPVAGPPDHTPDWMSRWRGIASRLKEETCLVYIIWSGSLESASGTHNPPMRQVIQSLVRPLHKDTTDRESVNHRLILLQLGSKGTKDYLVTDLYTKVFWKDSAEDPGFNIKECASFVCKTVNSVVNEKERQIQNNKSNLSAGRGKMEIDGQVQTALSLGGGSNGKGTHTSDSADKPVTGIELEKQLNTLFGKFNEKSDEVIKRVDGVGRGVEHIGEKIDEHILLPEGELQSDPSESYA